MTPKHTIGIKQGGGVEKEKPKTDEKFVSRENCSECHMELLCNAPMKAKATKRIAAECNPEKKWHKEI